MELNGIDKMNYNKFDNEMESGFTSMYAKLHKKILNVLQERPFNIYELTNKLKGESQGIISGQLQFLKKKKKVENKRFEGVYYWGIPQANRKKCI